jgi:Flp pilus assembly protein TadG
MKSRMTVDGFRRRPRKGVTLIELTVVIFVLLSMIGATMYFGGNISNWRLGKEASESLRSVYAAQRTFLADNPRRTLGSLTSAELVKYLPNQSGVMPTIKSLDGTTLTIDVKVSPPVCRSGDGTVYDPSSSINDSLWDVGS